MSNHPRHLRALVVAIIAATGLTPILLYLAMHAGVPSVSPAEARQILGDAKAPAVLVDVRTPEEYARWHITGALNWPLSDVRSYQASMALPTGLAGRKLLLICGGGGKSLIGARALRGTAHLDAVNVRGGIQEWVAVGAAACPVAPARPGGADAELSGLPFRAAPVYEQWLAVITGFVIKPVYMLAALVLVVVLWRSAATDLSSLRWAMGFFFLGETFCLLNYLLFAEHSQLFDYLHGYGMALTFGFTSYAILGGIDLRLLHFSAADKACAAAGLCRGCIKHADVPCGLRRVFLLLVPVVMVLALVPLTAPYRENAYNTMIFGTPYSYLHGLVQQFFEVRYLPAVALLLLAACLVTLLAVERHPIALSKVLFAAGLGALGFAYFRMVLLASFADNQVWFGAWEEMTELLYVAAAAMVLWVFRRGLFPLRPGEISG